MQGCATAHRYNYPRLSNFQGNTGTRSKRLLNFLVFLSRRDMILGAWHECSLKLCPQTSRRHIVIIFITLVGSTTGVQFCRLQDIPQAARNGCVSVCLHSQHAVRCVEYPFASTFPKSCSRQLFFPQKTKKHTDHEKMHCLGT